MYAKVIVDITHEKLDKTFDYRVPEELEDTLQVGMEVVVPFGKGNRQITGYVVEMTTNCRYEAEKVKEIHSLVPGSVAIEARLVRLAVKIKEYYGGTLIQALKTVLPIKKEEKKKLKRYVRLILSKEEAEQVLQRYLSKNQKARARVLAALLDHPILEYEFVTRKLNVTAGVIRALQEQDVVTIEAEQIWRNPIKNRTRDWVPVDYTEDQQNAIDVFAEDFRRGEKKTYLIHGVTGSGKTEVYMEMIARVVASGKQAIVLIPEIALTYQTVLRFYRRFGERISIMNSRMSGGERYDQMMRAKDGQIDVMIGPRSALFTPFPNLGLIVIDEEHEGTYKSEQVPRYHAREVAIFRGEIEGASVVLGSATPSVESYDRAVRGDYQLLTLSTRIAKQGLPTVYTVDLREELKSGNRSILSRQLQELIADRLEKKEQIMLFLNRRGYAGFLACRSCGYVVKCPHCDVSLSAHKGNRMVCHYCGYQEPQAVVCPKCGSRHIGGFRAGTQQIEEIVTHTFPNARVLRMDMDTTKEKDGHERILETFANGDADILIGTQMIVKGHDFPNVTLVGILAADLSLYADDYRAGERTFQLLTQAAGRAGRGTRSGEVVIQTYSPEHYSIVTASRQDYLAFYEEEIAYRRMLGYPPAEHLLAILLTGAEEAYLETAAGYLKQFAKRVSRNQVQIIGPASPYVGKVSDVYRRVIYMKHTEYQELIKIKNQLEQYIELNSGFQKIRIQFDFNPMNIF